MDQQKVKKFVEFFTQLKEAIKTKDYSTYKTLIKNALQDKEFKQEFECGEFNVTKVLLVDTIRLLKNDFVALFDKSGYIEISEVYRSKLFDNVYCIVVVRFSVFEERAECSAIIDWDTTVEEDWDCDEIMEEAYSHVINLIDEFIKTCSSKTR